MATMQEVFGPQLDLLLAELKRRGENARRNHFYYEGQLKEATDLGIPRAIRELHLKNSYRNLMSLSTDPWGSLIVDSVLDRLEATAIKTGGKEMDKRVWEIWQTNAMDAESKLAHTNALIDGRAYATIWPGEDNYPEIVLDPSEQMVMRYGHGRHKARHRLDALRYWIEGSGDHEVRKATLYARKGIYRFQSVKQSGTDTFDADGTIWERRLGEGEEAWPATNPFGVVPVVEISTNRKLTPGPFPHARGEFEHVLGLIDRINLLTYLGLIVGIWMGFPLRGVTGMEIQRRILKDDSGNPIIDEETQKPKTETLPPYEGRPDSVVQATSTDARFFQLDAADRSKLAPMLELDELAMLTKSPRHYFPMESGMANLSADAIRASEGGLHSKVRGIHKPNFGEAHEEVLRVAGLMHPDGKIEVPPTAELQWADHESRSMAERADAATKVASVGLPWQVIASKYLNFTAEEITQAESLVASSSVLTQLLQAANTPNGNGAGEPAALPVGGNPVN